MKFRFSLLALIGTLILLSGCASIEKSPSRTFVEPKVVEGEAIIYARKESSKFMCSGGVPLDRGRWVKVGDKPAVKVDCGQYAVFRVKPGNLLISVDSIVNLQGNLKPYELKVEAGKIYSIALFWYVGRRPGASISSFGKAIIVGPNIEEYEAFKVGDFLYLDEVKHLFRAHPEPIL